MAWRRHVAGRGCLAGVTAAGRAMGAAPPLAVLRRAPERGERAGRGLGGLNGGRVTGARYADPLRAEPPRHPLLDGRPPGVIVLPVEDQDRRSAEVGEFCRPIWAGKEVPGHDDQPGWAIAQHALVQERDDLPGNAVGPGLRLQVLVPEHPDGGAHSIGGIAGNVGAAGLLQHREHAPEQLGALAG